MQSLKVQGLKGVLNQEGNILSFPTNLIIRDGFKVDDIEQMLALDFFSFVQQRDTFLQLLF